MTGLEDDCPASGMENVKVTGTSERGFPSLPVTVTVMVWAGARMPSNVSDDGDTTTEDTPPGEDTPSGLVVQPMATSEVNASERHREQPALCKAVMTVLR
jgi:hypothetical protein